MARDQGWSAKAAGDLDEFGRAVQQTAASNLKADALGDVRNMALASLGVGATGAGLVGLYNLVKRNTRPRKHPSPTLALPYPVAEKAAGWLDRLVPKTAGFLAGDQAATKAGIPWYGPAMLTAGLAGLAGGWKGVDTLINKRRERDRAGELDAARQEFHDALMAQYDKPLAGAPPHKTAAAPSPMVKVGAALDALYDQFEKAALTLNDAAGQLAGGYGMYAGLTGLMTGALVYDKARKRQRRAILEKAVQRRERRKFNVAPPEIHAVPEPFHPPQPAAEPAAE